MQCPKIALLSATFLASLTIASCSSTKNTAANSKAEPVAEQAAPAESTAPADASAESKASASGSYKTVYFDFNKFNIRDDQEDNANQIVNEAKENPHAVLQVQGNTDDRGSVEYNMALGEKRANALKSYLTAHGVSASSIETISYGKEHPVAEGQNEDSWAKNRRDDVVSLNK